ncbi:hypothetical protein LUZ60_009777 [Juncus effusus]|nr:hypothetical protein LUZ60_009777 [Juncus effusus]
MAFQNKFLLSIITLALHLSLSFALLPGPTHFMGANGFPNGAHPLTGLCPLYYESTCPLADEIVMSVLHEAIVEDPRMAASLLRLHFHDCFVQGCDASVLLDDSEHIKSEKNAVPNKNSLRGFEVIDEIKTRLEEACPNTVSCADIVALAARGSTILSGGPTWELPLGRKDAKTASLRGANVNIPPPNSTIQNLITLFARQGLDQADLAALSGAHTIGVARCVSFKQRLYSQNGNPKPDQTLNPNFLYSLARVCPKSGGDNNITPLDSTTPVKFDNYYYKSILQERGLLNSDEVLLTGGVQLVSELVKSYTENEALFFDHFAKSMVKMGTVDPLTGFQGEVRKNCRRVNGVY